MLSRFFIHRPIFASVISLLILLIGLVALPVMPIEQTPDITPPTVKVSAVYPGASAEVIAETVAFPIENEVNGVDNMIYMLSKSNTDGTYDSRRSGDVACSNNCSMGPKMPAPISPTASMRTGFPGPRKSHTRVSATTIAPPILRTSSGVSGKKIRPSRCQKPPGAICSDTASGGAEK